MLNGAHDDRRVVQDQVPVVVEYATVGRVACREGSHEVGFGILLVFEELVKVFWLYGP